MRIYYVAGRGKYEKNPFFQNYTTPIDYGIVKMCIEYLFFNFLSSFFILLQSMLESRELPNFDLSNKRIQISETKRIKNKIKRKKERTQE